MAKIITDSTCDLTKEKLDELEVEMIPLTVNFGPDQYKDKVELSSEAFFDLLETSDHSPTTSLASPLEFLELFNKYEEDLVVLTLAQEFSGTYQSACIAREMSERDNIYIIDTKTVSLGLGLLVQIAVRWNKECTTEELVARLEEVKNRIHLLAAANTLEFLIRGGRLSKSAGALGKAFKIKPVLSIRKGAIKPVVKCRGMKSASKEIAKIVLTHGTDSEMPVAYAHTNDVKQVEELMDRLEIGGDVYCAGSVVGAHVGPGSIGVAYVSPKKNERLQEREE